MVDNWKLELFSPFLQQGAVDERLLRVLGIAADTRYEGHFGKALDPGDEAGFDFYMEAASGRKIFFEMKRTEPGFGARADDEEQKQKLERDFAPHLIDHIDAKWLKPETFFANYQVLRDVSYLGRYPDSGLVFIFPKTNDSLMAAEAPIKQIVSKSLAPRVAIYYLEYLLERILDAVAGDEALRRHFIEYRGKYIFK